MRQRFSEEGLEASREHPLAGLTTYGVGGPARVAVRVSDGSEAGRAASVLASHSGVPCLIVGRGSNMLVSDEGFDGVAILSGPASPASDGGDVAMVGDDVEVAGAMPMPVLARRAAALGRGGLEWAVGVPGSVGGAVRMNAGCHGSDMDEVTREVEIISFQSAVTARVGARDVGFHFRGSALADHHFVVSARLATRSRSRLDCAEEISRIVAWRRENQPGGRNGGSVFVNPDDGATAAGSLIEACGLRGHRVGAVEVSAKHANFIQAHEGATARDVLDMMVLVQDRVELEHGVRLRSEIRLVGFEPRIVARFADSRHRDPRFVEGARALSGLLGEPDDVHRAPDFPEVGS